MIGKLISLLFWLCIGAGIGIFLADSAKYHLLYAAMGMLGVAVILYIQEIRQIYKFSAWLRQPNLDTSIKIGASLDDAVDRILRFIKNKDKLILVGEESLRQFLAAIQASPHGVIILDKDLRIQWSNQTSSQHLGLDASLRSSPYL